MASAAPDWEARAQGTQDALGAGAGDATLSASLSGSTGSTHRVVPVRATGRTPEAVAQEVEEQLNRLGPDGWSLSSIQPIIYNSSTTGYLLLILVCEQ